MFHLGCAAVVPARHAAPTRRGPRPTISDEALLAAIKADLGSSPFAGEGHRKVWARLRVRSGIRVAANRMLRLVRQNKLLSPRRGRQAPANPHNGKIITNAPNIMWGADGARVLTLEDGWVWICTAVDHWNAECVGWHVRKTGDRYATHQPISMALTNLHGSTAADAARGQEPRVVRRGTLHPKKRGRTTGSTSPMFSMLNATDVIPPSPSRHR